MAQAEIPQLAPESDEAQSSAKAVRWWPKGAKDVATSITETVKTIRDDQSELRIGMRRHMRLYRSAPIGGFGPWAYRVLNSALGGPLPLNVVRNCCNTVTSKIAKDRPKATFSTDGASRESKNKARLLEQWGEGFMYRESVYKLTPLSFLDATIFGTGYIKVFPNRNLRRPTVERVFPPNVIVDSVEGFEKNPRNLYQTAFVDKFELASLYPRKASDIVELAPQDLSDHEAEDYLEDSSTDSTGDMVEVIEAFHLPSCKGAGDGRHVMCVGDIVLLDEAWAYDYFPYAVMRWTETPVGWEGMGLAEELRGPQMEINVLLRKIKTAFQMLANPYILADRASNIQKGSVTDIPGSFLFYNGKEPRVATFQTVHPEVFGHLDRLYRLAYEITGVSQMAAASKVPTNLESGRALLVHHDVQSDRFASVSRAWEEFHMDIVRLGVRAAKQIKGYKVKVFGKDGYKELEFNKDIDLDEDSWVMKVFPTSLLSGTPAGKLDMAERLISMGLVTDKEEMLELLDSPDLRGHIERRTAHRRLIERICKRILDGGKFEPPEAAMDLEMAKRIAQDMYLEAREAGVSRVKLGALNEWIFQCVRLQGMMMAPAAPMGPAGAMGAGGLPPGLPPGPLPPEMAGGPPGLVPPPPAGMTPPGGPQPLPVGPMPGGPMGPPMMPV